ncbi:lysM domain-containing GPI-anchored protein 1-like [Tasmannia lanceolata]|uniref:lysM domain-containing GPI-anchored protein 1-like n=1 Tax=Tasmannia lanceolata TaxID=3420 RepID=UPI004063C0CF
MPKTKNPRKTLTSMSKPKTLIPFFLLLFSSFPSLSLSKSTIEPCSVSDSCNALLGYTLYTDLKVSELSTLFQIDPVALLTTNSIDISYPDVENHILPSQLFLKIPIFCSCLNGIRKSLSTHYKTRPSDTLSSIADIIYSGLVSADQIQEANSISDPSDLDVGQTLSIPLPCTCFNSTDNSLPAVYLSYVVRIGDTVSSIAAKYATTVSDIMTINSMGNPSVNAGDILAIAFPACASVFPRYSSDFGLIVPNGSYAITASHCVQCSCGPGNLDLYCTPSPLAVSCSSMQCWNSNLMLGNVTLQPTSAGCNVSSCTYGGFVNGTIVTTLSTSLQPQCPGEHPFPPLIAPPTVLSLESSPAPAPSQSQPGGIGPTTPKSSGSGTPTIQGLAPATGPSGSTSDASFLVNPLFGFLYALLFCLVLGLVV